MTINGTRGIESVQLTKQDAVVFNYPVVSPKQWSGLSGKVMSLWFSRTTIVLYNNANHIKYHFNKRSWRRRSGKERMVDDQLSVQYNSYVIIRATEGLSRITTGSLEDADMQTKIEKTKDIHIR